MFELIFMYNLLQPVSFTVKYSKKIITHTHTHRTEKFYLRSWDFNIYSIMGVSEADIWHNRYTN